MAASVELRCLGSPRLIGPGGEPVRFRTRKHLALLAYLSVEPRVAHRRERLAELLWPEVPTSEGRHSLATAVSVLRAKLGRGAIESDRDTIRLTAANLAVDVARLESGDILGDDYTPALEVPGGFLEGFEIPEAPEYQLWRDRQRSRWLPFIREALVRLIDRCRRTGDFRRMEHLGDFLLDLDELSEDGIRAKMEARAFDGDRLTALKVFEAWRVTLAEALQASPSALLEGIAIRLRRRGWERAIRPEIPSVPTDQWKGRPFVGRATAYRTLYEAWEATGRSSPSHVLILGDSGVGKSTLLDRLITAAGLEGGASSRVQCYEVERGIPYAAVGALIEGLLDRPGASATPPEWLGELAHTVPEVRRRFPGIPHVPEAQGETVRIRLTEALQQLVITIAEEHPVILVIDDVHLADDASLAVIHLLMRRTPDRRLMVLMAARPAEMGQAPHAVRLRENHGTLGLTLMDLPPMTGQECAELLDSLVRAGDQPPSAAVRRALLEAAAGYPMVLEYLVRDWQLNGDDCLALSIGAMTEEPHSVSPAEHAYRLIHRRLVQELDPTTRNVLNLAAILGGRINDVDMYLLADLTVGQTMSGLAQLTDMRVLRDGGRGLEFCNELVRAETYLGVPSPLRRVLHGSIADRLLAVERNGGEVRGLEIAWHCIRAGRMEEATPYLLSGAREAMHRGAPHEAERGLSTALNRLKGLDREQGELLLVEALQEQGKWQESVKALNSAFTATSEENKMLMTVLFANADKASPVLTPADFLSRLPVLLEILNSNATVNTRARAALASVYHLHRIGEWGHAVEVLKAVEGLRTGAVDESDRALIAISRAQLQYRIGDFHTAGSDLAQVSQEIEAHRRADSIAGLVENTLGCILAGQGKYELAVPHFMASHRTASRRGDEVAQAVAVVNLVLCFFRLGDYSRQLEWYDQVKPGALSGGGHATVSSAWTVAWTLGRKGNTAEAEEILRIDRERVLGIRLEGLTQHWGLRAADAWLAMGKERAAYQEAAAVTTGDFSTLIDPSAAGAFARWTARIGLRKGEPRRALNKLVELTEKLQCPDLIDRFEVVGATAWLSAALGQSDAALDTEASAILRALPPATQEQQKILGLL